MYISARNKKHYQLLIDKSDNLTL